MRRRSKNLNAPLEVKENESRYPEEKKEDFFPDLSRDQKICKATKEKKASKKENLSAGNLVQLQSTSKHTNGKELCLSKEDVVSSQVSESFFGALKGDGVGEHALPLISQENFSRSKPLSVNECHLTPKRDKAEEKSGCGTSEDQRKKPVDFATVTVAEFGITPESFTKRPLGKSPTSLKYRRRSSIGAQGSPEHNTLIQYLAQQRSNRQKEAPTWQLSPFRHETLRSLKDKIDAFQTSFTSVEEVEETDSGFSGLSQVDDASQEAGSYFSSAHITEGVRSNDLSDLSRDKVNFVEEQSLEMPDGSKASVPPPITPPQRGNNSLNKCTPNGSHLRPVLKKTPKQQPMEECSSGAVGRGGGESPAVSSCAEISEALHTENTARHSYEMPKKKRVTFGEVLSPEIFDENLPANTPLCRGAAPAPGSSSSSSSARSTLPEEPLSQPNFDCSDECVEPLQELVEGPVAAEATSPVENAEAAASDKSDVIKTRSSTKRKHSTGSEGADSDFTISKATNSGNAKDTKNQKKGKFQRHKNTATSAAKKTQKTKNTNYGKRRKKKVKKSLYGEREVASKKPLLSPIPEIPEVFSSASSPNSPEANVFFSEGRFLGNTKSGNADKDVQPVTERRGQTSLAVPMDSTSKDLNTGEAKSSSDGAAQMSGDLQTVPDMDQEFSDVVPGFLQPGKETVDVKEAEESGSLTENEKLQANLLTGLEFLEQDINVHNEGAQITQSPQEDSIKVSSARRRRRKSSSIYFAPVEKFEITGNIFPVPSFNMEEVLSTSQLRNDSLESFRRQSGNCGEKRVRRSMRFQKEGAAEGLAWIQVPNEMQKEPPLPASARKIRRISTSILSESENIQPREQNLAQCSAPGKENKDSGPLPDGPCKRWRRRSICVSTPQETGAWSQTQRRSLTNSVRRKSRGNQKHYEEVEIPLENNS